MIDLPESTRALLNSLPQRVNGRVSDCTAKRYTPSEDQILKALAGRLSSKEIARLIGRTARSVNHRCQLLGVSLQRQCEFHHNARFKDKQVAMMRALRDAGFSVADIQQHCFSDVSYTTVYDVCESHCYHDSEQRLQNGR